MSVETEAPEATDVTNPTEDPNPADAPDKVSGDGSPVSGEALIDAKLRELGIADTGDAAPEAEDYRPEDGPADDGPDGEQPPEKPEAANGDGQPAEKADELSPNQRQALKFHGMAEKDLPTDAKAREAVLESLAKSRRQISRKASEVGEALAKVKTAQPAGAAKPAGGDAPAGGEDVADGGTTESSDAVADKLKFSEDDLDASDETLIVKLNKLVGTVESLQARLAQSESAAQGIEQAQTVKDVDAWFDRLWRNENGQYTSEFPEFGRGPLARLDPSSEERKAREKVITKARIMAAGYEAMGYDAPEIAELLEEAFLTLTPEKHQRAAEAKLRKALSQRRKGAIPRSAGRPRIPPKDDADARANRVLADWEKRTGVKLPD